MAQSQAEITLSIVESKDRRTFKTPDVAPFKRIVGLNVGSDTETLRDAGRIGYDRSRIQIEKLEVPKEFAARLGSFFLKYLVEDPRDKWGHQLYPPYNCHRFGYWMTGRPDPNLEAAPSPPNDIVERGTATKEPLALGSLGVLGHRQANAAEAVGVAVHSLIGLGEDREECLQVMSFHGCLGIDSYDNIRNHYFRNDQLSEIYVEL